MSHVSRSMGKPNKALFSGQMISLMTDKSTNDQVVNLSNIFLERNTYGKTPGIAALVFARIELEGKNYLILTRQWCEATKRYCIDTLAGVYSPEHDHKARDAGPRELREKMPLDAEVVFETMVISPSADGTSETVQILFVDAKPKIDPMEFEYGFDQGKNVVTIYAPENDFYEELQKLEKVGHTINNRLMIGGGSLLRYGKDD